jgi:rhodanese-related sulfurtransferase
MLLVAACRQGGEAAPGVAPAPVVALELPTLTLAQVEAQVGQPGVYLFDANPKDFYEHGHLPGARWVKFDAPARDVLPADRGATLIFYCANELCTASHTAAQAATALGYAQVFVMPEGFIGWKKSGRALVRPDGG